MPIYFILESEWSDNILILFTMDYDKYFFLSVIIFGGNKNALIFNFVNGIYNYDFLCIV